jgi:hypothetical protein
MPFSSASRSGAPPAERSADLACWAQPRTAASLASVGPSSSELVTGAMMAMGGARIHRLFRLGLGNIGFRHGRTLDRGYLGHHGPHGATLFALGRRGCRWRTISSSTAPAHFPRPKPSRRACIASGSLLGRWAHPRPSVRRLGLSWPWLPYRLYSALVGSASASARLLSSRLFGFRLFREHGDHHAAKTRARPRRSSHREDDRTHFVPTRPSGAPPKRANREPRTPGCP